MDKKQSRRLSVAQELMVLEHRIARLIRRINKVVTLPHITQVQTIEIELLPERFHIRLRVIQAAIKADEQPDRLIASMNRLQKDILNGEATIDRLLKGTKS
jgi:hypothetical protein